MKVIVHIHGACLLAYHRKKGTLDALMLNTSNVEAMWLYHHPILMARTENVTHETTATKVPSLVGLVDEERIPIKGHVGWHLSGHALALGDGGPVTLYKEPGPDPFLQAHPLSKQGPWADVRRIANLSAISPGSRLIPGFLEVGPHTLATVRLDGGELRGGQPINSNCFGYTFSYSPSYQQAVTDSAEFSFQTAANVLTLRLGAAQIRLQAADTLEFWLINEAPPAEVATQQALLKAGGREDADDGPEDADDGPLGELPGGTPTLPNAPHFVGYYRAITDGIYGPLTEKPPIATWRLPSDLTLEDTAQCPIGFVEYDDE